MRATPHVHVREGGQAIVGTIEAPKGAQRGGGAMTMTMTMTMTGPSPHGMRHGRLNNGNRPGDFTVAPRCAAKTRRGTPCQCPATANGRCRLHGGLSTGPKTVEGIERIRRAVTKHGRYSAAAKAERRASLELLMECRAMLAGIVGKDENGEI
jgi:hypothetical protein